MIQVKFAEKSAWRAIYIYAGPMRRDGFRNFQVAHLGIDPCLGPRIFGGICFAPRTKTHYLDIKIPHISWRMVMRSNYNKHVVALYKLQQEIFYKLDGRYGWGSGS
jgi:hypothetical protein